MLLLFGGLHQISICLSASERLVIRDDWNFTLSAFSHSVAVVVATATGDSDTMAGGQLRPASYPDCWLTAAPLWPWWGISIWWTGQSGESLLWGSHRGCQSNIKNTCFFTYLCTSSCILMKWDFGTLHKQTSITACNEFLTPQTKPPFILDLLFLCRAS